MNVKRLFVGALVVTTVLASTGLARGDGANDPVIFKRPGGDKAGWCPPTPRDHIAEDKGSPGTKADGTPLSGWLLKKSYWEDADKNDVTVEEWCVDGDLPYHSLRVSQSKNGASSAVAYPGGKKPIGDPGEC